MDAPSLSRPTAAHILAKLRKQASFSLLEPGTSLNPWGKHGADAPRKCGLFIKAIYDTVRKTGEPPMLFGVPLVANRAWPVSQASYQKDGGGMKMVPARAARGARRGRKPVRRKLSESAPRAPALAPSVAERKLRRAAAAYPPAM